MFILFAFLVRLLFTGASIGEALVILSLSVLYGFTQYLKHIKEPQANQTLITRLIDLEEQVKTTKETIHSVKLGVSLRK